VKPRIADVFGGAGGSAKGYELAGFEVVVVDSDPKLAKACPFEFVRMDAFEFLADHAREFDAIHVGPPCQAFSPTKALHDTDYPRWINPVRIILDYLERPYVIENVVGARAHMRNPIQLCGSSFGLGVRRHRLFETSFPIALVPPCAHYLQPEPIDVTGTGASRIGPRLDGGGGNSRKPRNLSHAREVMGIDWMSRTQLAEAIPPVFTQFIGAPLAAHLAERAA
jgi:DNA (cytosine-5)-methyltransferase 1